MKICFLVDYRSPISRSWIGYFLGRDHEVHVISTCPAVPPPVSPSSLHCVATGLGNLRAHPLLRRHVAINSQNTHSARHPALTLAGSFLQGVSTRAQSAWRWVAPYEARVAARHVTRLIRDIEPDLVHAMRIPFEAILGARALARLKVPFLVSVWGNDFTLHAQRVRSVAGATRYVLKRADALHADCERDIRLAREWGFDAGKPSLLVPGNGGVRPEQFHAGARDKNVARQWRIPIDARVVLNARSFRPSYVRNDIFFAAIPAIRAAIPDAIFVCVGMQGNAIAQSWVRRYDIADAVRLLPPMQTAEMAALFRFADVAVSPSNHDGTPNTLLEAMACGAFPVAGDIESVREWIADGRNGLLCDPNSVDAVARTLVRGLTDGALRARAAAENREIIMRRAEFLTGMRRAEAFYYQVIGSTVPAGP